MSTETDRDRILRSALWAAASFNAFAAYPIAFPASALGQMAGLPDTVPLVYRMLTAMFVLLFGGVYVWLARSPSIDRPLLALGAIGKTAAFVVAALLWLGWQGDSRTVMLASGDLGFAALFTWWLATDQPQRPS